MEFTHVPEEVQAQFQQCVEMAIGDFFKNKVSVKLACDMALNKVTKYRSPDIAVAETSQEIWFLLEAEVTARLREKVGLEQKDPIVQTAVTESPIGKVLAAKSKKE